MKNTRRYKRKRKTFSFPPSWNLKGGKRSSSGIWTIIQWPIPSKKHNGICITGSDHSNSACSQLSGFHCHSGLQSKHCYFVSRDMPTRAQEFLALSGVSLYTLWSHHCLKCPQDCAIQKYSFVAFIDYNPLVQYILVMFFLFLNL